MFERRRELGHPLPVTAAISGCSSGGRSSANSSGGNHQQVEGSF
jgi:hypothetical protein